MGEPAACYWPSGEKVDGFLPCKNITQAEEYIHCCGANDYCFTNGLCLDPGGMTTYRGACTDLNFESASCPKFCTKFSAVSGVWACDSNGNFACELVDCDNTSLRFAILGGELMPGQAVSSILSLSPSSTVSSILDLLPSNTVRSAVSLSSSTAATTTAISTTSSTSAQNSTSCSTSKSTVAAVGAGVGVPLLLGLLAALAFLVRERRRFKATGSASAKSSAPVTTEVNTPGKFYQRTNAQELSTYHPVSEIDSHTVASPANHQ